MVKADSKVRVLPEKHEWAFKFIWPSTALSMIIYGKDLDDAYKRAARQVKHLEGGLGCLDIKLIRQVS